MSNTKEFSTQDTDKNVLPIEDYEPFKLTDKFIQEYKGKDVPWGFGDLSWVTFKRTYSRKLVKSYIRSEDEVNPDEKEDWYQTCRRVIEGMFTIQKLHCRTKHTPWDHQKAMRMAKEAYERMFNFKWTPPGRGLWIMGTDFIFDRSGAPLNNCGYTSTNSIDENYSKPFTWTLQMSMLGVGIGYDTRGQGKLTIEEPEVSNDVHTIGDSREGWAEALGRLLDAFAGDATLPEKWDYSEIRPRGEPIKSFGGTASGPEPLKEALNRIEKMHRDYIGEKVDSVLISDTFNLIGKCVVAGGTRRSAMISIGDKEDQDFLDLKLDDEKVRDYRWASNNSIYAEVGMDYSDVSERTVKNGEPGYVWMGNVNNYGRMKDGEDSSDKNAMGFNPCAEQPLEKYELCTLVELYPYHHETYNDLQKTLKIAYLYGKTVTLVPTHSQSTNQVMQKNRRIGCSMTGIVQAINEHGYRTFLDWCDKGYEFIQQLDKKYSDWLGIPESIRTTSVKPSGCRPWYSLTSTDKGLNTMDELFEDHKIGDEWGEYQGDTEVLQDGKTEKITNTYDNGKSEVIQIEMSYGLRFEGTPNHKLWVKGKHHNESDPTPHRGLVENGQWKRLDQIEESDVIDVELGKYNKHESSNLKRVNSRAISMRYDVRKIEQPDKLDEDLCWFLGFLWGDGAMSPHKYRIRFSSEDKDQLTKVVNIVKKKFDLDVEITGTSGSRKCWQVVIASKYFWHWLIKNDVWKYRSDNIDTIPRVVRESSKEDVLAFISGIIDADGCASFKSNSDKSTFTISISSDFFAQHLQDICWAVGIGIDCSHNTKGKNYQKRRSTYLMTACVHQDPDSWPVLRNNSLKMSEMENHPNFKKWVWQDSQHGHIVGKVRDVTKLDQKMNTFDIEVKDDHWYYAGSIKSHNTVSLLSGSTPGVHWSHSPYFVRRMRVQEGHKILDLCREAGYPIEDDIYSDNTKVIEFPINVNDMDRSKFEVGVREKVDLASKMQYYWSDNSVSTTAEYDPDTTTAGDIQRILESYEDRLKSVSFLPSKNHGYEQPPYEQITKEDYENRIDNIEPVNRKQKIEHDQEDKFCSGEACKVDPAE